MIPLSESPNLFDNLARYLIDESYTHKVDTLRAQIHTSVGHMENVAPEKTLLDKLEETISRLQNDEG